MTQPSNEHEYGYCPKCGIKGILRERRPNGNDKCMKGHTYPSRDAVQEKQKEVSADLPTRLREYAKPWPDFKVDCDVIIEAADKIEQLERLISKQDVSPDVQPVKGSENDNSN